MSKPQNFLQTDAEIRRPLSLSLKAKGGASDCERGRFSKDAQRYNPASEKSVTQKTQWPKIDTYPQTIQFSQMNVWRMLALEENARSRFSMTVRAFVDIRDRRVEIAFSPERVDVG